MQTFRNYFSNEGMFEQVWCSLEGYACIIDKSKITKIPNSEENFKKKNHKQMAKSKALPHQMTG